MTTTEKKTRTRRTFAARKADLENRIEAAKTRVLTLETVLSDMVLAQKSKIAQLQEEVGS